MEKSNSEMHTKGSTALPYPHPIVFLFLFSITAVLSVVGNVLVVIVLVERKRLTKGVRYLLVNLAVADFFMAVLNIPYICINNVYGDWFLPEAMCKIVLFALNIFQVVSVLTLTVIGLDRYFAIVFPLKFHCLRSDRAIIIGLVIVWLVAIGGCMLDLLYSETFTIYLNGIKVYQCDYKLLTPNLQSSYTISNFLITYSIPIVILVFVYSSIAWKLFRRTSPGNADAERDQQQRQNTIKVIRMLILIVVVFVLCWLPLQGFFVVGLANANILSMDNITLRIMFVWFAWIAFTNCFANPFIYCFSSNEFLKDLKIVFSKSTDVVKDRRVQLKHQTINDFNANIKPEFSLKTFY